MVASSTASSIKDNLKGNDLREDKQQTFSFAVLEGGLDRGAPKLVNVTLLRFNCITFTGSTTLAGTKCQGRSEKSMQTIPSTRPPVRSRK
jgi:hypothetical protein